MGVRGRGIAIDPRSKIVRPLHPMRREGRAIELDPQLAFHALDVGDLRQHNGRIALESCPELGVPCQRDGEVGTFVSFPASKVIAGLSGHLQADGQAFEESAYPRVDGSGLTHEKQRESWRVGRIERRDQGQQVFAWRAWISLLDDRAALWR